MDTPERRDLIMVKMNVKFETPEQLVEFSRMCQKVEADTLIEDTVHKLIIDGKSVMGMMTVTLNQRLIFVVDGSDEKEVLSTFEKIFLYVKKCFFIYNKIILLN